MIPSPVPSGRQFVTLMERIHAAMIVEAQQWWWVRWRRFRLRLGTRIVGGGLLSVYSYLWLVHSRAKQAVTEDGRVILAECEPLAEALYRQVPGEWTLTIARTDSASPVPSGHEENEK